jgi:hypothetical protein
MLLNGEQELGETDRICPRLVSMILIIDRLIHLSLLSPPHFIPLLSGHISYTPTPGSSTPGDVEFTIDSAWGYFYSDIYFNVGYGSDIFVGLNPSTEIGTFTDAAGDSYTFHRNKFTHTFPSTIPRTVIWQSCCRIGTLKNDPHEWWGVATTVVFDAGFPSSPRVSMPAIIQMYESKANSIDIKPFIFYSGSDIVTCSYNADGAEFHLDPLALFPYGFASLPAADGIGLVVTNDCKLEWDLTNHNPTSQFDKYAVSMVIKIVDKSFVQSIDFIIELVKGTAPLTCVADGLVQFYAYPGETKQASFTVGGAGSVGTVSLDTVGLPTGATVGTSAASTAPLPAVWVFSYTVPENAPTLSQTILQWNQGAFRCCKNM